MALYPMTYLNLCVWQVVEELLKHGRCACCWARLLVAVAGWHAACGPLSAVAAAVGAPAAADGPELKQLMPVAVEPAHRAATRIGRQTMLGRRTPQSMPIDPTSCQAMSKQQLCSSGCDRTPCT